ncbi:hypothetical protein ACWEKJ_18030 [Amycolatopsis thermoflava]
MTVWQALDVQAKVCAALGQVTIVNQDGHHFGRPYMTAYQLAIKLHRAHPEVAEALNVDLGGRGTGARNSLAQYLARELSSRIRRAGESFPVEGAFLSNDELVEMRYLTPAGEPLRSSLTGSGWDLSLFRLRVPGP